MLKSIDIKKKTKNTTELYSDSSQNNINTPYKYLENV